MTEFSGDGGTLSGLTLKLAAQRLLLFGTSRRKTFRQLFRSGNKLECNLAVVGIGAAPNVEFCEGSDAEELARARRLRVS